MKKKLTQEFIDTFELPSGKKHMAFYDTACRGFYVLFQRRSGSATSGLYRVNLGHRKYKALGGIAKTPLAQARLAAETYRAGFVPAPRFGRQITGVLLTKENVAALIESRETKNAVRPDIPGFRFRQSEKTPPGFYFTRVYEGANVSLLIGRATAITFEQAETCAKLMAAAWERAPKGISLKNLKARLAWERAKFFAPTE